MNAPTLTVGGRIDKHNERGVPQHFGQLGGQDVAA